MILKIYFALIMCLPIRAIPEKTCSRLRIGHNWYEKRILITDIGRPYNLYVHKLSNILFFSYTSESYSDIGFQLASYNLDTKESQTIVGIREGCAVAIDQGNDEIYLGGSEGIYKYNVKTKIADFYKEDGVNIWSLYHKRNLFYIRYPDQKLHIEIDGKFVIVKEFSHMEVDHFYVSNKNIIYFSNKTGLYKFNNIYIEAISELLSVRQITEDNNGEIYICSNVGLHTYSKDALVKILDMKSVFGVAFDKDNDFILSDEKSIFKLEESKIGCASEYHW